MSDIQNEHKIHRVGWLRAAVLGANDGIISTASLLLGVAAAGTDTKDIMLAGIAGLVAGATSMATGEYVSVSSQADTEQAELELEQQHIEENWETEHQELAEIYIDRGLDAPLADTVATKLMEHDALGAHARDELGMTHSMKARPLQAAIASALTFAVGAALPILVVVIFARPTLLWSIPLCSIVFLVLLGSMSARAGGAPILRSVLRVTIWGGVAMALTAGAGAIVGKAV
jgi:vacuolar iron transporter family protein